ncbi:MAG: polyprenol monophosphomannose synthase [Candidatus Eisenbacteria bacterium]|uniref:Polyprenol monophosphomannose synthase n=1 Tax=Eiseniibacteriota bacterium TaxID=2212470 RepID=A0A7Y2EBT1_UNCEI|nr:polyprenol monophosphomannose synthase [Candidatus Eisenbacteria bacterium]
MKGLVITPTYNEVDNVEELVPRVLSQSPDLEILIVDDNSTDGTGDKVEEMRKTEPRLHCLHRPGKMGLGTAYVDGFRYALERDYELVFEMDADFSHDPDSIPAFLEAIQEADLVVGSRYLNGVTVVNWPLHRLILSYGANLYTRIVTRMPLKDATGGFKCFRRSTLEAIDLNEVNSDGYGFQVEMNFKAWRKKLRVKEIPILFVDRQVGASKMSNKIIWEAMWLVWRLRFDALRGKL